MGIDRLGLWVACQHSPICLQMNFLCCFTCLSRPSTWQ